MSSSPKTWDSYSTGELSICLRKSREQRQTGRLNASEVEAAMKQYAYESQHEQFNSSTSSPPRARPTQQRRNWSNEEGPSDQSPRVRNASTGSTDPSDLDYSNSNRQRSASSASGASSSQQTFPYSSESYSYPTDSSSPPIPFVPAVYKRGGNSMFGGRVQPMKMSKSPSSFSLKSNKSAKKRSESSTDLNELSGSGANSGENSMERPKESSSREGSRSPKETEAEELGERYTPTQWDAADETVLLPIPRDLDQLYPTSALSTSPHSSIAASSDVDHIDPFFHRAPRNRQEVNGSTSSPTQGSTLSSLITPTDSSVPPPSQTEHSAAPSLNTIDTIIGIDNDVHTPLVSSTPISPSLNYHSRSPSTISVSSPFDEARPRQQGMAESYETRENGIPSSYPFPGGMSSRTNSISDDGPFDLSSRGSLASKGSLSSRSRKIYGMDNRRRAYASTSGSTGPPPSALFSATTNESTRTSIGSVGSSYHALSIGSDDEGDLGLSKKGSADDVEHLMPSEQVVSRRPSKDELMEDLRSAHPSHEGTPIAIEDVVFIQEELVRSASRRAAMKAVAASAHSGSSPSLDHLSSRKPSFETTENGKFSMDSDSRAAFSMHPGGTEFWEQDSRNGSVRPSLEVPGRPSTDGIEQERKSSFSSVAQRPLESFQPASSPQASNDRISRKFIICSYPRYTTDVFYVVANPSEQWFPPEAPTRVAREPLTPRNPHATQSILIRDVRNQANSATMSLKKSASSPRLGSLKRQKSVKNMSISNPQFVSGPDTIPAVPILNPEIIDTFPKSPEFDSSRSPSMPKSPKSPKSGLGTRFKSLLRKQSRDQLSNLNGDEVTPFDHTRGASPATDLLYTSPTNVDEFVTPAVRIASSSDSGFTQSAEENRPLTSSTMEETNSGSPSSKTLSRVMSRMRRSGKSSDSTSNSPASSPNPASTVFGDDTPRPESIANVRQSAAVGLGLGVGLTAEETASRAPVTYDIGSRRRRGDIDSPEIPQTAPLSVVRNHTLGELDSQQQSDHLSESPQSAPLDRVRYSGTSSVESVQKLRSAAEDLGLHPEGVKELVDLSYNKEVTHDLQNGHTRNISNGTSHSLQDRVPTPPPGSSHRHKPSHDLIASPVPPLPESFHHNQRLHPPAGLMVDTRSAQTNGGSGKWKPSLSPGEKSFTSTTRSSSYAGSILDFYGDGEEQVEHEATTPNSVSKSIELETEGYQNEEKGVVQHGGNVWTVLDDLRRHRLSSSSTPSEEAFAFHSRHSSVSSVSSYNHLPPPSSPLPPVPTRTNAHGMPEGEPYSFLRSRPEKAAGAEVNPPSARFPSIFLRDEERLEKLADLGGVAAEERGNFMIRGKYLTREEMIAQDRQMKLRKDRGI